MKVDMLPAAIDSLPDPGFFRLLRDRMTGVIKRLRETDIGNQGQQLVQGRGRQHHPQVGAARRQGLQGHSKAGGLLGWPAGCGSLK